MEPLNQVSSAGGRDLPAGRLETVWDQNVNRRMLMFTSMPMAIMLASSDEPP